ncbi:hypothetical protein [Streptomyces sp. NPDC002913]
MMPAAAWFIAAGAQAEPLHRAWSSGGVADVPIGQLWDVVRLTTALGHDVLDRVRRIGSQVGPVLETPARGAVEYLVPRGTAATWPPMVGTRATGMGLLRCPSPGVTLSSGQRSTGRRSWIVPPLDVPSTTDADALCEAVAAALLHRAAAVLSLAGGGVAR